MLADAGPGAAQVQPQLKKLFTLAQKKYEGAIAAAGNNLSSTKNLLQLYKEGKHGENWYQDTRQELEGLFGEDAPLFSDFLAATSPNMTVASNVTMALKAYARYRMGLPFETGEGGFQKLHASLLDKAAAGEQFGGLKVGSFKANLFGDPTAVTVDRWIARAMGFGDKVTDAQYKFADYMLTQIAQRNGMEPRQLQAAIWTAVKEAEQRNAGNTSLPFEKLLPAKIAKDPQMQALIGRARAGEKAPDRPPRVTYDFSKK
jgi:hypothetical protein